MKAFLFALALVVAFIPFGVWAVGAARRQRGAAVMASGLLLVFGLGIPVIPPPPPVAELVRRAAEDDDGDDPEPKLPPWTQL